MLDIPYDSSTPKTWISATTTTTTTPQPPHTMPAITTTVKRACHLSGGDGVVVRRDGNLPIWGKVVGVASATSVDRTFPINDIVNATKTIAYYEEYDDIASNDAKVPTKKWRRVETEIAYLRYVPSTYTHTAFFSRYKTSDGKWHTVDCDLPVLVRSRR